MLRVTLATVLAFTFYLDAAAQDIKGSWIAEINEYSLSDFQEASLTMKWTTDGERFRYTFNISVDELQKFAQNDLTAEKTSFILDREAGELVLNGSMNDDLGSGNFTFSANTEFLTEMSELGYNKISPVENLKMAIHDVTTSFVKRIRSLSESVES